MIYLLMALLAGAFLQCAKMVKNNFSRKAFVFLAFLVLFIPSAIRYGIGTDYFYTYVPKFNEVLGGETRPFSEWGFSQLYIIIASLTSEVQWVFVITSFIYSFFIIMGIKKLSPSVFFSIALLFLTNMFFVSLNNIRQSVAISILFYSLTFIKNNNFWKFLFMQGIAFLFHHTSIIFLPMYFVYRINFFRKNMVVWVAVMIVILPFLRPILMFLLQNTKYIDYFDSKYDTSDATLLPIVYNIVILGLSLLYYRLSRKKDRWISFLILIQFLATWLSIASIFIGLSEMIDRIRFYFSISQIILIPFICNLERNKIARISVKWAISLSFMVIMVYTIIILKNHEVWPYRTIFG